jgi:hypothetical protein
MIRLLSVEARGLEGFSALHKRPASSGLTVVGAPGACWYYQPGAIRNNVTGWLVGQVPVDWNIEVK